MLDQASNEPRTPGQVAAQCLRSRWARIGTWLATECDYAYDGGLSSIEFGDLVLILSPFQKEIWVVYKAKDEPHTDTFEVKFWTKKGVRAAVASAAACYRDEPDLDNLMRAVDEIGRWNTWWS